MNGCLNRAREGLYWPGMTADIKNYMSTCEACREYEQGQVKEIIMSPRRQIDPGNEWLQICLSL